MLKNYLKISIAVLLRRKFLTFVNLFGTVLTLTILVVAFAAVESRLNPRGAQAGQRHFLVVSQLRLESAEGFGWGGGLGLPFYERYVAPLAVPDKASFYSKPRTGTSYLGGGKIEPVVRYTDAAYWEILDFEVLGGRTIAADDVEQGRSVAVINEATAHIFFPDGGAVGETITVSSQPLEVIGVVTNEPETSAVAYADVWVPLTADPSIDAREVWVFGGEALLYVEDPRMRRAARDEYARNVSAFEGYSADHGIRYDAAVSAARTPFEIFAGQSWSRASAGALNYAPGRIVGNPVVEFLAAGIIVMLLVMTLPAINMINLNVGRMLERAPEIGLRKAAGASKRVLLGQFLFENLVLTALGGLVALGVALLILRWLNEFVYTYGALSLNVPIFLAGLAFVVLFGMLSGGYPAWRMAKLEPAAALRGGRHV